MTTNAFIESPIFPLEIGAYAKGGAVFNTSVVSVNSGYEQRNANWSQPRAQYDIAQAWRTLPASNDYDFLVDKFIAFFYSVQGMATGFRYRDFNDYIVTSLQGVLGLPQSGGATTITGATNGLPVYQLYKNYTSGSNNFSRIIPKPVASSPTPIIYNNGTPLTVGTDYSLDTTTGLVTLTASVTKNISTITTTNPGVVTTSTSHGFSGGEIVYISGAGGMTQINGKAYTVTVVNSTQFSIGIDTTNYTPYTSGGTAAVYLQPGNTLTWEGNFDVPVRFDSDDLRGGKVTAGYYEIDNLSLVEIRI